MATMMNDLSDDDRSEIYNGLASGEPLDLFLVFARAARKIVASYTSSSPWVIHSTNDGAGE